MNKTVLSIVLLIIALAGLSIWSDKKVWDINGPTRLVHGSNDTVYILIDDMIAKASAQGDLLSTIDLKDLGISEHITDFIIEEDGKLMVGLAETQEIRTYSPEGKLIKVHSRVPSLSRSGLSVFKFVSDPKSKQLYIADTNNHRIQIYGPDEKEITTLWSAPLYNKEAPIDAEDADEESNAESSSNDAIISEPINKQFKYPNGLIFKDNLLYVADTDNHRIVLFNQDGSFDRVINTVPDASMYIYPTFISMAGNILIVINRGPSLIGGEVMAIDTLDPRHYWRLSKPASLTEIDPQDVLATEREVLVSDRNTMDIYRFAITGEPVGRFGKDTFNVLLENVRLKKKILASAKWISLGAILLLLLILLHSKRKERKEREAKGLVSMYQPIPSFQRFIGPSGSFRRDCLLDCIPGLGQIAAGRVLRAIFLLLFLCLNGLIFAYFLYSLICVDYSVLPMLYLSGVFTLIFWIAIVMVHS